jgi:hypothetical protein
MTGEYKWLAVLAEFERRAGKLSEGIGDASDGGLCAARATAVGLAVSDVEAVLGVMRNMLAKHEGVHDSCGEDSQRGCWVCRPLTAFQTPDGEVIQLEEDEAWEKEQRGEGVRMELVEFLQPMGALKAKPKGEKGTGGKDNPTNLSIAGLGDTEEKE